MRYVITWRKEAPNTFDWDHHFADSREEAETVIARLKGRGVHQYGTYPIGERAADLSSEY